MFGERGINLLNSFCIRISRVFIFFIIHPTFQYVRPGLFNVHSYIAYFVCICHDVDNHGSSSILIGLFAAVVVGVPCCAVSHAHTHMLPHTYCSCDI